MAEPLLRAIGITKTFGAVRALDAVSADFYAGEIHAVVGENGAGKTTLMNVLAGILTPDSGRIELSGKAVRLGSPLEARANGVEMVHQHFMLVPNFTAAENLALARLDTLRGSHDAAKAAQPALKIASELGWQVDPSARTGDLPVGVQQRIEILKALSGEADIVIFDEPTAVLSPEGADDLLQVLRAIANQGRVVILIAHKLSEIMRSADRITVLRQGRLSGSFEAKETTAKEIAEAMIGSEHHPARQSYPGAFGEVVLSANDLRVRGDRGEEAVRGLRFDVHAREIFGIGGVDGNGQVELAEALAGVRGYTGSLDLAGKVGYIPQNRQTDGLALTMPVLDNFLISGIQKPDLAAGPFIRFDFVRSWVTYLQERYKIKFGSANQLGGSLSGGNQQKIVVSRILDLDPRIIIAVNPTRGLDFASEAFVHEMLRSAASSGAAVVLFSTDRDELQALARRTVYLSRGKFTDHLIGAEAS